MQITIEVPDAHINNALLHPHSNYWTNECEWDPVTQSGYVIDQEADDAPVRRELTPDKLRIGLIYLAAHEPRVFAGIVAGEYDGPMGDVLLQSIAFGAVPYG